MGMLLSFVANSQQYTVKVLNSITNEPIVGASLKQNSKVIAISNERGEFKIGATSGEYEVSSLGFMAKKVTNFKDPILLEESTQNLDAVVVTASRQAATRAETPVAIHKIGSAFIQDA